MANLYTFFDNGTWEASPITYANQNPSSSSGITWTGLFLLPHSGIYGSLIQTPSHIYDGGILAHLLNSQIPRIVVLIAGHTYKLSCWIKTPSTGPIGTDDLPLGIGEFGGVAGGRALQFGESIVTKTVAQCKDVWQQISWTFISNGNEGQVISGSHHAVGVIAAKSTFESSYWLQNAGVVASGSLIDGGFLYLDDIVLEEVSTCTLGYDNPAFDKTNCTTIANDDGTITVHAHGTGTLQYRLDAGAWQLSNVFTDLAPGTYAIDIKDDLPCTQPTVNATILEYLAPPPPTGGDLVIDEKPVNNYNLVPWFGVTNGDVTFGKVDCVNHYWDLPKPYDINKRKQVHAFVVKGGEEFTFYINFDTAIDPDDLDFDNLRLGLANNAGMVNMNLAALQKDANDDGTYNLYATATISPALSEGNRYFLVIYRADNTNIVWVSGRLELMLGDNAEAYSARYQYRHSQDFYHYYFSRLSSLLLKIRMRVAVLDEQPEASISQYRSASGGELRNVSFELDKSIKLETYYYDVHGIRGMYTFQAMETIIINDKNYVLKTPYKTEWSQRGQNTHKGSIEFFEQEFSTQNRYGNPSTIIIVGSDDQFLQADNGELIKI